MNASTLAEAPAPALTGKAERRARIIAAARALIGDSGEAGFSMTALAIRAGVSPATPYNLVGPRTRVLEAIVEQEFDAFRIRMESLDAPPGLGRVVAAAMLVTEHYGAEPAFYRGLYHAMVTAGGEELRRMMGALGQDLWGLMVQAAAAEFDPLIAPGPFTDHLLQVISSTTQGWLAEGWSSARYRAEMRYGVLLALSAAAAPARRPALLADLSAAQAELMRLKAPGGSLPPR
ncbi:TetR/AcrR family transcriptional regulator [Phenylobacterium sp.]|uniref:TetR/AcrR family transcriptional regulator n=1 Tax=Phenylobacterium sp. TaxID=1871053 RepID=UPI0035B2E241